MCRDVPLFDEAIEVQMVHHLVVMLRIGVIEAALGGQASAAVRRRGLGFAPAGPHRHVPEGPTGCPVPLAALAEVSRLVHVVVVEVTELGLHALASRARYDLFWPFHLYRLILILTMLLMMMMINFLGLLFDH